MRRAVLLLSMPVEGLNGMPFSGLKVWELRRNEIGVFLCSHNKLTPAPHSPPRRSAYERRGHTKIMQNQSLLLLRGAPGGRARRRGRSARAGPSGSRPRGRSPRACAIAISRGATPPQARRTAGQPERSSVGPSPNEGEDPPCGSRSGGPGPGGGPGVGASCTLSLAALVGAEASEGTLRRPSGASRSGGPPAPTVGVTSPSSPSSLISRSIRVRRARGGAFTTRP